ncbi:MAG: aminotransferase class I/II-fold pyridoxal phosphate-dependent enzyme [Humidesulfovibrio sp.]|nr:aminotransferase class I/II-fold pyridoxal phosphate-dependent enzyme [Humidesulfovibrio sp.]
MPTKKKPLFGLSDALKRQVASRRQDARTDPAEEEISLAAVRPSVQPVPARFIDPAKLPGVQEYLALRHTASALGATDPFFHVHEGIPAATTRIGGREFINFSNYNYLNLNGHPEVSASAKAAIDHYGTSASASRMVSGERPLHGQLERALADFLGTEDCVAMVSGHATNVTVIGHLFGKRDLILHDALAHNSVLQGALLSGAKRLSFPHNDWQALDNMLRTLRPSYERVLVVVEGLYSMDGDFPDLPRFAEIRERYKTFLLVDEAHSIGVMGATGRGIAEHFGLPRTCADFWMGTLSKTFSSCGGFIAGQGLIVDYLRHTAPGFLYSVGMSPPLAAASLTCVELLKREPERCRALRRAGRMFLELCKAEGLDTGGSAGLAIVPIIVGSSMGALTLSSRLFERGINVQPIFAPAVEERQARLRFFLCCEHTQAQLETTAKAIATALAG